MKFRDYLPAAGVVLGLITFLALFTVATINRPPPDKRAFKSDWICGFEGGPGAEHCERRTK